MRQTPEEILQEIIESLARPRWNYKFEPHEWFFPGDVKPHNANFKRQCKRLYELGLLERHGDGANRWGYSYRVPLATKGEGNG